MFANNDYYFKFSFLGIEPLLNPEFDKIVKKVHRLFPYSYKNFLTNRLLLNEKNSNFPRLIKKCNINVFISKYPINTDRTKYDYIRIAGIKAAEQIFEFMKISKPLFRYCKKGVLL